jgi:plasmid replication initiation protein
MGNELVVQSNKLIEAHYKQQYTVQEQRMVLWVISEIHKEDYFGKKYEHKTITISAQKYAELIGADIKDIYKRAQEIGDNLMQKVITIKTDAGWEMFHWVESMKYHKNTALIEVLIAPAIIPYIVDLQEKFTEFRLENILYLRSSHAIKLYQLLAQYKYKTNGEREMTINELKSILGINDEKGYVLFSNIKIKILKISEREINAKTDLIISYSTIKTGKKVTSIKFKITQKPTQELQAKKEFEECVLQLPNGNSLKIMFQNYGFDQASVKTEFQKFLAERIINYDPLSSKPLRMKKII